MHIQDAKKKKKTKSVPWNEWKWKASFELIQLEFNFWRVMIELDKVCCVLGKICQIVKAYNNHETFSSLFYFFSNDS
jgi:hypothetical protein